MTHKGTVTIKTPRLILRRFRVEDAPAMYANWASDPRVTDFLTWQPHTDVSVTKTLLEGWVASY